MFFILAFLLGLFITLFLIKYKSKWAKWMPAIIFFLGTILMGGKAKFFPAPEMAVLGEIMYFMILGLMTIGALIGGLIIKYLKRK